MRELNPGNERIKKAYVRYLRQADRKADSTIRGIEKAIRRFEVYTGFVDFARFNADQAMGFKAALAGGGNDSVPLGKATIHATVQALKRFFAWLACQPGYKSKIRLSDIDYLNLSEKDVRAAKAPRFPDFPTLEQVRKAILALPSATEVEQRDRALIAFTVLTGIRDGAMVTLRLKHVDLERRLVKQDPTEVATKFSKRIDTYFFPVGDELERIVVEWVDYLREVRLFGQNEPLFPRTGIGHDADNGFIATGVVPEFWATAAPVREVFRAAFAMAGLPYFSPHSFRSTLVQYGERHCRTPEEFKAWSQNLGHEQVLTTFNSYGRVSVHRQGELIRAVTEREDEASKLDRILAAVEGSLAR